MNFSTGQIGKPANRHLSRNNGTTSSVDIVTHSKVTGPRLAADGGVFDVGYSGQSRNAVKRLGTASNGHGRQFLITEFKKNLNSPHFSSNYNSSLANKPDQFRFKRSEFSDILNTQGANYKLCRPSEQIFNILKSVQQ